MNSSVRHYVKTVIERYPQAGKRVLEIGSYDVNGNVRDLFADAASYLGIDKRPGPNVDVQIDIHTKGGHWTKFDTVLCLEMLEHDTHPYDTLETAWSVLDYGGRVIVTTRGIGYGLHDTPEDYWRFTEYGLRLLMDDAGFQDIEVSDHTESKGVFGCGMKR